MPSYDRRRVPPRAHRLGVTGTRALVDRLTAIVARFAAEDSTEKLDLLDQLEGLPIRSPATLAKLHEALCFLRAYPDGPQVQERVERALTAFPARVARLGASARARLDDSGIAGTTLDYPFGFPMARWLASRFSADVEIAWRRFGDTERLEELLPLLVTHQESEAFSEGGLHPRRWMALAKGHRRSDLRTLLELFERAPWPLAVRDALFEGLALPIEWRLRGVAPSRTRAILTGGPRFMHGAGYGDGLRRGGVDFAREITRPLPPPRPAGRALSRSLIDMARASMATRARELYAFSHPNPNDVLVADPGRGLRVALIGLASEFRLPVQAYYAFLLLKNGVPMSYGAGWGMGEGSNGRSTCSNPSVRASRRLWQARSCASTIESSVCAPCSSTATRSATRTRRRSARARSTSIAGSASGRSTRLRSVWPRKSRRRSRTSRDTARRRPCSAGWPGPT